MGGVMRKVLLVVGGIPVAFALLVVLVALYDRVTLENRLVQSIQEVLERCDAHEFASHIDVDAVVRKKRKHLYERARLVFDDVTPEKVEWALRTLLSEEHFRKALARKGACALALEASSHLVVRRLDWPSEASVCAESYGPGPTTTCATLRRTGIDDWVVVGLP